MSDLGAINWPTFKVIDRSKTRRARSEMQESFRSNLYQHDNNRGLYFDRKKLRYLRTYLKKIESIIKEL